jgi:hypothetical protein
MRPLIAIALLGYATWYCARIALAEQQRERHDDKDAVRRWESEGGATTHGAAGQRE